ncbi:hypothetical protein GLN21_10660 [Campylobacter coli]|nr:hypothetical protein [Campylobacter coli]
MNLPIYSNIKAKLESKGLDSTTSGQIAWLGFSGAISVICSFIIALLSAMDFISIFLFIFLSFLFWTILAFLHKQFISLGFLFFISFFVAVLTDNNILFIIGAFVGLLFWFLTNKLPIRIKLLLSFLFLIFGLIWFILFFVFTNKIILA